MEIEFSSERVVPGKTPYGMLQEHIGRYVFARKFVKESDSVLDVACGVGYGTAFLARKAKKVLGGDIDGEAVSYAGKVYSGENRNFVLLNGTRLPFSDHCFDVIVSVETIEHLPDYQGFLKECRRVMKDDGLFICTTPNGRVFHPWGLGSKGFHIREFAPHELRDLLGNYWSQVVLYGQCHTSRIGMIATLIENYLFEVGECFFSIIHVRDKVKGFIDRHFRYFPSWVEISEEMLDRKYAFFTLKTERPAFLGAVATDAAGK